MPVLLLHQEAATSLPLSEAEQPWKRAKLDMLSKHITTVDSIEREIQQFRCLSITTDDTLAWWAKQRQTFLRLTELTRCILAIPATSAPAERVFSQAGLTINAKR